MSDAAEIAGAPPPEISADITARQAVYEAHYAYSRVVGPMRFMKTWPWAGALLGVAIGIALGPSINAAMFLMNPAVAVVLMGVPTAITAVLAVLGFVLGLTAAERSYHQRYMIGMYERGMPAGVTARFVIGEDALVFDTTRIVHTVPWPCIAEVSPTPRSWLIAADFSTFVLPKDAFASEAEERAFIGAMVERLSPAARERSVEARGLLEA